jgi:hypothetical protein
MTETATMNLNISLLEQLLYPLIREVQQYCTEAHNYLTVRGEQGFLAGGIEIKNFLAIRMLYLSAKAQLMTTESYYSHARSALYELSNDNIGLPQDEVDSFHAEFFNHYHALSKYKGRFAPTSRILLDVYSNPLNYPVF